VAKRIKSGLKRLRQSARRRVRNQTVRSRIRTLVKRAGAGTAPDLLLAIKAIDKAAARGVIHKNAAARKKSRLIRRARLAAAQA
jgi:small subunit ribosomal protein S20